MPKIARTHARVNDECMFSEQKMPSEDVPPPMLRLAKRGSDQISELLRRELIPFDVGDQPARPTDDGCVQRMVHQPFVGERLLTEEGAYPADVGGAPGQEMPAGGVGLPA